MSLIEKIISQVNLVEKYEPVSEASKIEWDNAMSKINNELEIEAPKYLTKERIRAAKTAELSKLYMLG